MTKATALFLTEAQLAERIKALEWENAQLRAKLEALTNPDALMETIANIRAIRAATSNRYPEDTS